MGKIVALLSACAVWITLSATAAVAAEIFAEFSFVTASGDGSVLSGSCVRNQALSLVGISGAPSAGPGLTATAGGLVSRVSARDWSDPLPASAAALLFTGPSTTVGGPIYSIDPHTLCVTVIDSVYGMCELLFPVADGSAGGSGQRIGASAPASQSVFMVVAGLTLIGLSSLVRNGSSESAARVYAMQHQLQPWSTRSWKDQPVKKAPAYQVRAA
jgi:hypothetical protein